MINVKVELGNLDDLIKDYEKLTDILADKKIINDCINSAYDTLMDFTTNESLMRATAFLGNAEGWRSASDYNAKGEFIETSVNDNLGYYHWGDGENTAAHNKKEILSSNEGRIFNDLEYIYEIEFGNPFPYDYELDEATYQRYVKRGYPESYPNAQGMYEGHTDGYEGLGIFCRTDLTMETKLDDILQKSVNDKVKEIIKR